MRLVDRAAALLVLPLGLAHLAVGRAAFLDPTEPRIWFASAGLLLIVTGLANLAAVGARTGLQHLAGLSGGVSILVVGALLRALRPRALVARP